MARERLVTRTIDMWGVDVLYACMHENEAPTLETVHTTVPGHIKEEDIAKWLSTDGSNDTYIYVKMAGKPVKVSTVYGMPESKFLLFAEPIER
nr:MAG TPA: hypothetical protein [Caudoviricetes sp.]